MGFKPIFEEERMFFKEQTGIELPTDCWRNGSKIYLDFTQEKPLYRFKVDNKKINITKDNSNGYKKGKKIIELPKQIPLNELISTYTPTFEEKFKKV
jgi:phosphoadenosine phosphosulfate reductase